MREVSARIADGGRQGRIPARLRDGAEPEDMLAHVQSQMYEPDYRSYVPV